MRRQFFRSWVLSLSLLAACAHAGSPAPDPAAPPPPPPAPAASPEPGPEPTSEPSAPTPEPSAPTTEPTSTPSEICALPEARGPCKAAFQRYRFDSSSGSCVQFIYGGCQGNKNNFETKEACEAACKP